MKNSALIKWLDKQHDQESIMIEMGLGEDGECEINKMHLEVLKRKVEDSRPKWISVKDKLPPHRKSVLTVKSNGDQLVSYIINHDDGFTPNWQWTLTDRIGVEITHWQPLPTPQLDTKL